MEDKHGHVVMRFCCLPFGINVILNLSVIIYIFSSNSKLVYSYCHGTSDKPLLGETIGERFDRAVEKFPDREAYVFCEDGSRASFSQFKQEVGK